MSNIIIALPKLEDAKYISSVLSRYGMKTTCICDRASTALKYANQMENGVLVCSRRLLDMHYSKLLEYLPEYFDMLLLTSKTEANDYPSDVKTISLPIKTADLVNTIDKMLASQARIIKKRKMQPRKRTEQEQHYIEEAKRMLMERNHMTEQEAFRYLQKASMNSETNMVETAQKLLMLSEDE